MTALDLMQLVRSNLLRMKLRVLMTAAGVVIGTTAVILLVSLGAGLQRSALQEFGGIGELTDLRVYSPMMFRGPDEAAAAGKDDGPVLNDKTLAEFRQMEGVVAVSPVISLNSWPTIELNRLVTYAQVEGLAAGEVDKLGWQMASGQARLGSGLTVAGAGLVEQMFDPRTGNPVVPPPDLQGQTIQLTVMRQNADGTSAERKVRLRVSGVLKPSGYRRDMSLYLSTDDVLRLNAWLDGKRSAPGRDGYTEVLVRVDRPERSTEVYGTLTEQGYSVESPLTVLESISRVFIIIQIVLGGIGGVALLVAAFGIANTMIMAIYERTREIGLMKAVGATNQDVMFVFLLEATSIGLIGGLGGVLLGLALSQVAGSVAGAYLAAQAAESGAGGTQILSPIYTPFWLPIFAVAFAGLVGIVSGIYPALRATHLDPITALRAE